MDHLLSAINEVILHLENSKFRNLNEFTTILPSAQAVDDELSDFQLLAYSKVSL